MTSNFVAFVNVLLPICCYIGSGMPNLLIFVEDIVGLLGAMNDTAQEENLLTLVSFIIV